MADDSTNNGRWYNPPPTTDPTSLTTEQLDKSITSLQELVFERIDRNREVAEEQFKSIQVQFKERDTRQEREARDNSVAVGAAFAAQKEAAAEQNKSNTLAISKSEASTKETIDKMAELFKTTTDGITSNINDLKLLVAAIDQKNLGAKESKDEHRATFQPFQVVILGLLGGSVVGGLVTLAINLLVRH